MIVAQLQGLRLRPAAPGDPPGSPWEVIEAPVSVDLRQTLVDTATIQELLRRRRPRAERCGRPESDRGPGHRGGPDHHGPAGQTLGRSLRQRGRGQRHRYDVNGWADVDVLDVDFENATNNFVILLNEPPGDRLIRIVVRGTGPTPLLGTDAAPFAGRVGGASAAGYDGADFAHHIDRRQ